MLVKTKLLSSLEKVFLRKEPDAPEYTHGSALKGEVFSFQIAYGAFGDSNPWVDSFWFDLDIDSPLKDCIEVFNVENVPVSLPINPGRSDDNFLTYDPCLIPDLMVPVCDNRFLVKPYSWFTLRFTVKIPEDISAGKYVIPITLKCEAKNLDIKHEFTLNIIDAVLPKQETYFTQWFHTDCIADYYDIPVFSEKHWELIEKFMRTGAENGLNLILTPIFTPPLDTAVGGERTTVQLTDVTVENGKYTFGFEKLGRWIDTAHRAGIENFEIAHLFTQWGGAHAPKIIATVDGVEKKIFGWETEALGEEYTSFLKAYLPELSAFLKSKGVAKNTFFHISDEPSIEHLEQYAGDRELVDTALGGEYPIIDALSNYEFYSKGVLKKPIPSNDHIKPFLENKVPDLWTYYCCVQSQKVSNRFMAMPAYRNRIIGLQMYKFNIVGFLHWGYNFYNSRYSWYKINPFLVTDAAGSFVSGDSFSVYPGKDGPLMSTRLQVFNEALTDIRALKLLETLIPREEIVAKLDSETEMTFANYPHSAEWLLGLREWVNEKIAENV